LGELTINRAKFQLSYITTKTFLMNAKLCWMTFQQMMIIYFY